MTRDPIRRRFGKGAARLRVGIPPEVEPLSALARTPIRLERRLTVVPFLTALAIVWLLVTSPDPSPRDRSESETIQIVLEAWPVPRPPAAIRRELAPTREPQPTEPKRRRPTSTPAESLAARRAPPSTKADPAANAPRPEAQPFDPAALATRGAHWSEAEAMAATKASADWIRDAAMRENSADSSRARPARGDSAGPLPIDVARATRSAQTAAMPNPIGDARGAANALPLRARPGAGAAGTATGPSDALVEAANTAARSRHTALAALDRSASDAGAQGAAASERRPEVSAPRDVAPLFAGSSSGTARDGWQEVPLDALPDCNPPGRQDLLKKRILLAAAVKTECSHASGSFRFVEARSLGAFLMWSRPNPDRRAGQPRDRDACDVLQRALACLGDPSSQESKPR